MSDNKTAALHHRYVEHFDALAHDLTGAQSLATLLSRSEGLDITGQEAFRAFAGMLAEIEDNATRFGEAAEIAAREAEGGARHG